MNNKYFIRRYYRYLNRDVPIPDFSKIDISKYDFSKHFENVPEEINFSTINPSALAQKLTREKELASNRWGAVQERDKMVIRDYIQMEKLTSKDYSWNAFDELAYRYQYLERKEANNRLSHADKIEMENLFVKMLSCMIHFYTKKENYHLQSAPAAVDIDDYDSIIAMTLVNCLALNDLSQEEILKRVNLSEADAGTILLNEFGISPDFWFSSKEMLFSIIEKKKDYFGWNPSPYIVNGKIFYPQEAYCDFYEEIQKLGKRNKIVIPEPKCHGFNRRKAQRFSYYLCGSIEKEMYKMYRKQCSVHVPFRHKIPSDATNTVAIMTKKECDNAGWSEDYANKLDAEIVNAVGQDANPADIIEEKTTNNDFFSKVLSLENGELLLYKVGVDYDKEQNAFFVNKKRTYKTAGEKFGMSEYEAKKAAKRVATAFKRKYPNFYNEYVSA